MKTKYQNINVDFSIDREMNDLDTILSELEELDDVELFYEANKFFRK